MIRTPDGRRITREEALQHLAVERLALLQLRLKASRAIAAQQREIDSIDGRLEAIEHAEGLLQ